ncbi:MAG: hypothetical protein QUS14_06290 [Pyrinomonadaceae bacterium]|nr:hypothetical protein [Pyrinomonadaceae bacterium]
MEDVIARIIENLGARVTGPMHLRLYMQPLMAAIFAIIAGWKDAKGGRPAYFWAMFTQPEHRREMLKDGWKSVGKVLVAAIVLDIIYQLIAERWVYPFEVILVAFILAIVPYLILRGVVNRLASCEGLRGDHQQGEFRK